MQNKKFEITNEVHYDGGRTLYRIKALKDFNDVKAGDIGGWVEKEENLSQEGTCWLYDNSAAVDNARVEGDAWLYSFALVKNNGIVKDNGIVLDTAVIQDDAIVSGMATVAGNTLICNNTIIKDKAIISFSDEVRIGAGHIRNLVIDKNTVINKMQKYFDYLKTKKLF